MMQMMGEIFTNQEQQRLTNARVTSSITNISASSGCAIEAAPTPQPIITLPSALVRLGGVAANPGVTVTPVQPNAAAATETPALAARAGGEGAANAPSDARKRSPQTHSSAGGGAALSTAAAIMSAGGSPPRKKYLPPGKGAPPRPEDDGRLSDGDGDTRRDDEPADGGAGTVTAHGTATMMQCLYTDLYGNPAPSKAQMMATGESERSPALVEADAKRVETELSPHRPWIFYHGRSDLDPEGRIRDTQSEGEVAPRGGGLARRGGAISALSRGLVSNSR